MTKTKGAKMKAQRRKKCSSGKAAFRDRIAALMFMAHSARTDSTHGKDLARAYRCPECRKWHLTSQPRRH